MSVEWSTERAAQLLGRPAADLRLVVAHLGSGCSVTATDGGRSVATSMGLTPLEGLMMGTRAARSTPGSCSTCSGRGASSRRNGEQLDHQAGLLGVSSRTSDVRELLRSRPTATAPPPSRSAIFARRAAECIAAAATSLPGLDAIVFTGGIGENAAGIRARIVARLASAGIAPIADAPAPSDAVISSPGSSPAVLRIEAREDLVVARAAARLVEAGRPSA